MEVSEKLSLQPRVCNATVLFIGAKLMKMEIETCLPDRQARMIRMVWISSDMISFHLSFYLYLTCMMLKKYLPYIFLVAAALFLWYIKKNQRGAAPEKPGTEDRIIVPAVLPKNEDQNKTGEFNRAGSLVFSKHARCRMDCRHIDESEVREILEKGEINYSRVEESDQGRSYPLEGITHDQQHVRIVFAPKKDSLVVVTVIDLDKEWACDCK